jgi:hypothetical protein
LEINLYTNAHCHRGAPRGEKMPNRVSKKKDKESNGLPVIECTCGAKILLVPNVKVMSQAIEAHALEHANKIEDPKEAEEEAKRVLDDLTIKVLNKASEL